MNDNQLPIDDVLQLVFGELDAARQADVRKAIAENAELAASARGLEAAVVAVRAENVGQVSGPFNDRLRQRTLEIFDQMQPDATRPTLLTRSLTTWRWIMRHPVSSATAAAIFVFAIAGVALWFHGGGTTPVFADFLQPILEAKTVKYKVTTKWTSLSGDMGSLPAETRKMFLEKGITSEVMMLDANRIRTESDWPEKTVHIWDGRQRKSLSLIPGEKRATVSNDEDTPKNKKDKKEKTPHGAQQDTAAGFRAMLLDARNEPGVKREPLGEREIDGRRVVGVRITSPGGVVMSVWGDPKTGLPARIETTMAMLPNMTQTQSDFEFNVPMDESLFSVEPPADYEVGEFFIGHPTIDPSSTEEKDLIETFRQYSRLSGGPFPATFDMEALTGIVYMEFTTDKVQKPGAKQEIAEIQTKLQRGLTFGVLLPKEADAHYAGKGVSLGAADRPIFWYRPKDSKKYRVIYADLSIRDADTPPSVPVALPEQDLIDTFRCCCELSGGPFPNALDMTSLSQTLMMKEYSSEEEQDLNAKQDEIRKIMMLKLQPGLNFTGSLPPEADMHYAGKGVSLGTADRPIFWYRPKDSKTYRVIYADLSVRDADMPSSVPAVLPEQDLLDALRYYSDLFGGPFPLSLDNPTSAEQGSLLHLVTMKLFVKFPSEQVRMPSAKQMHEVMKAQMKLQPGLTFVGSLPAEADMHYAGRGVSLGAADRPIFWYHPKDSKQYRVIDADLSVREVDTPPNVPIAPPEQDLLDTLRYYSELSGGPFPDALDSEAYGLVLEKKLGLEKGQEPSAKQKQEMMPEIMEITLEFQPGLMFANQLPPEADTHYAGKGVSLGAADRPIFWYRPKDAKQYRVIYADLSVRDADTPPNVPDAQAVPAPSASKKRD